MYTIRVDSAPESTIDSEGFKGGTRDAPIIPRDAVSRTANVERTGRHKWVKCSVIVQMHRNGDHFLCYRKYYKILTQKMLIYAVTDKLTFFCVDIFYYIL